MKTCEPQGTSSTGADKKTQRLCSRHFSGVFRYRHRRTPLLSAKGKLPSPMAHDGSHALGAILSAHFRPGPAFLVCVRY
jgi:hypothetical protein